jgi:hypothetical protein
VQGGRQEKSAGLKAVFPKWVSYVSASRDAPKKDHLREGDLSPITVQAAIAAHQNCPNNVCAWRF